MIVVDASVIVSALIADNDAGERMRLRLDAEVANAWRRELLVGHIGEDRSRLALDDLAGLRLARMPHRPLMPRIWELRHNLTPYDAAYVALAEALDAKLLTADGKSTRAPTLRCEVELIQ